MSYRLCLGVLMAAFTIGTVASEREIRDSIALGALVFSDNCRSCHQIDGYGEEALYPSLHDPALLANRTLLIKTILHGRMGDQGDGTEGARMPSLDFLTDREVAAVIAFITNSWGYDVLLVTEEEVSEAR